jgi:hypothetical protein
MALFTRALATLLLTGLAASQKSCNDQESQVDISSEAMKGSSMLQVHKAPSGENIRVGTKCSIGSLEKAYLQESLPCLPEGLPEVHLQALRRNAMLLSTKGRADKKAEDASSQDPESASLDAVGFQAITSLCCPGDMETFFTRLLVARGLQVCSKPHIQGLVHWFSCVPDMDFNYVLDVIDNGNHKSCKYWAPTGTTCPTLSSECEGKFCR